MDMQVLDDQLKLIYNSSVQTGVVALKTSRNRWTIKTSDERESRKSLLRAHDDDDDDDKDFMTTY